MDALGPLLMLRVRTTGHRLFHRFGLCVTLSSPLPRAEQGRKFLYHQGIAQRIKFALFLSRPSSSPLYSIQPSLSIHHPSPAFLPTFPLRFSTPFLPQMPSPVMMLNTISVTYGQHTTASTFVRTPSFARGVASNKLYASNVCSCTAPPPPILPR